MPSTQILLYQKVRRNQNITKRFWGATSCRNLICVSHLCLRKRHIPAFPAIFSFLHFLASSSCLQTLRVSSLNSSLKSRYKNPNFCLLNELNWCCTVNQCTEIQKFENTIGNVRANETKLTSKNVLNLNFFPLGGEKESKYLKEILFSGSLQKLDMYVCYTYASETRISVVFKSILVLRFF